MFAVDSVLYTIAPIPTFFATSSFSFKSGFFSAIISSAFSIVPFIKSSIFTTFPSLVDILPVGKATIPYDTCSNPFTYFSSTRYLATANICLKCRFCSYATTYKHLSKSYVFALYIIAAKSLVAYIDEPFAFCIKHGVFIPTSVKSTIFAPSESVNTPFSSSFCITSSVLSA